MLVGTALAARENAERLDAAAICLSFAVLVQIGTNFANDYYDHQKGADTPDRVGPRRAVAAGLVRPQTMRRAMMATFAAAFLVGLGLLPYGGWPLIIVGITSIACGIAYTGGPYPLAYHGWGDVFVLIFFGFVAVGATVFVQTGNLPVTVWAAAGGVGALATNILVTNNYRDIETDAKAGKNTLLVRWGRAYGRGQFAAAHAVAILAPAILAAQNAAHPLAAGIVTAAAVWIARRQIRQLRKIITPGACIVLLGQTGRWLGIYGLLLSGSILLQ